MIAVIDDSAVDRELAIAFLRDKGYEAVGGAGGTESLDVLRDQQPDLCVIDLSHRGTEGLRIVDAIRGDTALHDTPLIVLTSDDTAELAAEAIERGADDYVRKPSHVELLARIETVLRRRAVAGGLEQRAAKLATAPSKDVVTDLPNKLLIEEELGRLLATARRHDRPLCVALVDIDGMGDLNESGGRDGGDETLRRIGRTLASRLRASDFLGRWGGDEYLVLLPDTAPDGAENVTEGLRAAVERTAPPTVSIGWAQWNGGSGMQLIARAEEALAAAKMTGPNSVRRL